jgi:hypothetical protein
MMGKSKWSVISLLALGILVLFCAAGRSLIEWEWWDFLLILSGMAFIVGLVLFLIQSILRSARS